jgi:hypothetical protein
MGEVQRVWSPWLPSKRVTFRHRTQLARYEETLNWSGGALGGFHCASLGVTSSVPAGFLNGPPIIFILLGYTVLLSLVSMPVNDGRDELQTGCLSFRIQVEENGSGCVAQEVLSF